MNSAENGRYCGMASPAVVAGCLLTIVGLAGPAIAKTHDVKMTAVESDVVIDGGGEKYAAWTFNGQMPGPVVRVTEGDTVNFTLTNPTENKNPHAMDFHAAEIDFLKNYRAVNAGETITFTFVAKKPGVFFYHCGAPPMIQHVARGMFGAVIVDPKDSRAWPKADREYVLVQSELFKNPNDVQGMFDRKFDHIIFNGGVFKYHPFVTGGHALEAKPGERVRIYFVNAGPNEFSAFHPIGEIWDHVYESGNPANKLTGVQTHVVGPGSAAVFDVVPESGGAYPLVTHALTGALRGAIAVLVVSPEAKPGPLMPHTPWKLENPPSGITPPSQESLPIPCERRLVIAASPCLLVRVGPALRRHVHAGPPLHSHRTHMWDLRLRGSVEFHERASTCS